MRKRRRDARMPAGPANSDLAGGPRGAAFTWAQGALVESLQRLRDAAGERFMHVGGEISWGRVANDEAS
jgi:hypothetical protein